MICRERCVGLLLGALLMLTASFALANPASLIARYSAEARAVEARDTNRVATSEIGVLREWLGEAQAYLRAEEEDDLKRTLRRVRVQARLIHALLDRAEAEESARAAHGRADGLEREAASTRKAAFELERTLAEMEGRTKP